MMQLTLPDNLKEEFQHIIERGNEAEAREFLIANIKQFSQETQDAIVVSLLEEALEKKVGDDTMISNFRKEILTTMKTMGDQQQEMEKQEKLAEIREKM